MRRLWLLLLAACAKSEQAQNAPWLTQPTADEHTAKFFPLSGPHAVDCATCHGDAVSFKSFDCVTCHADSDAKHAGVVGYSFTSGACYSCHPNGTAPAIDHSTRFPIGAGASHAAVACADCHVDASDMTRMGCAACHDHDQAAMAPAHASVGGYAWDSSLCLRCHDLSVVTRVAAHLPFALAAPSKHAQSSCLTCHPNSLPARPWAQDFTAADCSGCHADAKDQISARHPGVAGFALDTASCLSCHPDGKAAAFDHTAYFPIAAADKHASISCATCHVDAKNAKQIGCSTGTCHPQASTPHDNVNVAWADLAGRCAACHAESQVDSVASHTPFNVAPGARHFLACWDCHVANRADKTWAVDFTTESCTTSCHPQAATDARHAGRSGYVYETSACLSCHGGG